jgi:tRNA pseudouridine55 synthase
VVRKVRGLLRERKIGHTGTLDPLATGVLVLCTGKATRIIRYLESDDKEYTAELKLGTTTETQDSEGRVVGTREYDPPSQDQVLGVLGQFRGVIRQRPPAYSALKVSGIPSYRLARAGTITEHEERPVTIHRIALLEYRNPVVRFSVRCSKGTYVRTLCADIGARLGMGAHLTALIRTRAGMFRLENARSLEQIGSVAAAGDPASLLLSLREALGTLPEVTVEGTDIVRIVHGNAVALPEVRSGTQTPELVRLIDKDGSLVAVARVRDGMMKPETVVL